MLLLLSRMTLKRAGFEPGACWRSVIVPNLPIPLMVQELGGGFGPNCMISGGIARPKILGNSPLTFDLEGFREEAEGKGFGDPRRASVDLQGLGAI